MAKKVADPTAPKKTVTRKAIKASDDVFYQGQYSVVARKALNFLDPADNSNKFYQAEVHEGSNGEFRYFFSNGRVGAKGVSYSEALDTLNEAMKKFNSKVNEKLRKGYVETDLATMAKGSQQSRKEINQSSLIGGTVVQSSVSTLPVPIAKLVELLYSESNKAVSFSISGDVKTDATQPLGNFGIMGITNARQCIAQLAQAIKFKDEHAIEQLSIAYYRNVPRVLGSDLRKSDAWKLNTEQKLAQELDILDLFEDALRMLPASLTHNLDTMYQALMCDIAYVEDPKVLDYVRHKVRSTKAPNHNFGLDVLNVYELNQRNAPPFDASCGNAVHLFHGSRNAHLLGILSSYLKIPSSLGSGVNKVGAMFGDGIYFADNSTKSANYSYASFGGQRNGSQRAFLFIAEVALGNVHKVSSAHYFRTAPAGYHSVMGVRGSSLQNNEFIVYNPSQVRLKYLVEVRKV